MKKSTGKRFNDSAADLLKKRVQVAQIEQELRSANAHLAKQLVRAKAKVDDYVAAIRQAVLDSVSTITVPRVPRPKIRAGKGDEEKAIITLGDPQFGKLGPTYNSEIAGERIARYAETVLRLTQIARHDHPVQDARVYLLGDFVEGEIMFPHQQAEIDSSLFDQIKNGAESVVGFLQRLLSDFYHVHVAGVVGNHGRLSESRRYNSKSNADRILYLLVQTLLRDEPRLTWDLPEDDWQVVDYPFEEPWPGFLLFHGHEIPGSASHSVATVAKHIYGYASGAVAKPFNYAIYGHWHTPRRYRFNRFVAWCNGSIESTSTYAREKLAALGFPEQLLLFVHPRRGVTSEWWCQLEELQYDS